MTPRRRVIHLVVGVVAGAAVVAGVAAAAVAPWPGLVRDPLSTTVTPEAAGSTLACDGPLLALGRDETAAGQISVVAAADLVSASGGADPETLDLRSADRDDDEPAVAVLAPPTDGTTTELAAASAATADDDDIRGLAVGGCTAPAMESWIVGGSAATGASDILLLANPGTVAAAVDVRVYGAAGVTDPASGQDVVVPARTQRAIPLASLAPGEESPALRITADGAAVRASLQSTLTRTLVAGGVDLVGATASPAVTQIIPAVDVTAAAGETETGTVAGGMTLRLLAPDTDATADVVVRAVTDGRVVAEESGVALTAGQPLAVDLTGMPVGRYQVEVTASAPVAAAAWTSTDLSGPADFAWSVAASPLDAPTLVAVADAPEPALTLVAEGDTEVTVTALGGDAPETVALTAGEAGTVAVEPGEVYRIDPGDSPVRAAIGFVGDGLIGTYPVPGSAAAAAEITVYP